MSALEFDLTDIMDKIVVDDWGQFGPGKPFGALRRHVDEGKLIGEARCMPRSARSSAGLKPGRESDDETILFWHRGLALSDIALGAAMVTRPGR